MSASITFAVKGKIDNRNGLDTVDFIKPKNYLFDCLNSKNRFLRKSFKSVISKNMTWPVKP